MYYIDITLSRKTGDAISFFDIASKVFQILHGINSKLIDKIALDFLQDDDFLIIRAFSVEKSLNMVKTELERHNIFEYIDVISCVCIVPDNATEWVENRRKRVPDKSSRLRDGFFDKWGHLLHFKYQSRSNGNKCFIYVEQRVVDDCNDTTMVPNNYGLSSATNKFYLPRF